MKFNIYVFAFLVLLTIGFAINDTEALSCIAGRAGCMASCVAQNCATGYCTPAGAEPRSQTCVCSRCGIGPPPFI